MGGWRGAPGVGRPPELVVLGTDRQGQPQSCPERATRARPCRCSVWTVWGEGGGRTARSGGGGRAEPDAGGGMRPPGGWGCGARTWGRAPCCPEAPQPEQREGGTGWGWCWRPEGGWRRAVFQGGQGVGGSSPLARQRPSCFCLRGLPCQLLVHRCPSDALGSPGSGSQGRPSSLSSVLDGHLGWAGASHAHSQCADRPCTRSLGKA